MCFALRKGIIQAAVDGMGMTVGHGEMIAKGLATGMFIPLARLSVASQKSYLKDQSPASPRSCFRAC